MCVLVYLFVVHNNNNSVCLCSCLSRLLLSLVECVCGFLSIRVACNNLRANRLGQWILSDAYLVALCAIVERAGCISGHISPIAIPVAILCIQVVFACRVIVRIVVVAVAAAAAAAIDCRLP